MSSHKVSIIKENNSTGAISTNGSVANELAAVNQGQHNVSGANSDEQMIDLFIGTRKSISTRDTYGRAIENFREFTNFKPLQALTVVDLNEYREWLEANYGKKATRRAKFMPIKSLLTYAQKVGYIHFNVGSAVPIDNVQQVIEDKVLSERQIFELLNSLKNDKHKLMVYVLYACGGRISEFINLRWKDIQASYIIFRETKGDKVRRVPLPQSVLDMIRAHQNKTKAPVEANDFVFTSYYRKQYNKMTRQAVNDFLSRISKQLGFKVTPHMLRHSIATHSIDRGTSVHTLRDRLGHSSIAVTNVYLHSDDDEPLKSGIL